ncbi:helix-turn-helix domain-containing protein [Chelatococcus sp. SYSU_G07232]|uniref:Helix-turn-helix domain-containing protein n=1 Tax=Chelatococcus albus TaxID=3047466 RepID=A0ABT7AFC3_9HYPH|nr:helix-turn-helix domain-containing protein [Chelatococcus sp. SYSU_G07232]MDJ1158033.1 helix-turn-helix domain-containing protein [Chelatococcus sp. SYSU_G07232]
MMSCEQARGADTPSPCPHARSREGCVDCKVRLLSICAALDAGELCELESLSHPACFEPRTTLFLQDEPAEIVYNVTDGVVRLYRLLPDGRRQIVGFALPGDFLGLSMADRFGFSADAVTRVTTCRFPREVFSAFVDTKPHLLRRLHEFASHELSLAQDQMVLLGRRTAEEKVASFLMSLRDRWARVTGASVTVPLPMGRQDIADFLGLTIETVSRTLTRLARERALLIVPDGVRLLDLPRLERLAVA